MCVQLMKERCRGSEQCLAFNSKGEFKNHVLPHSHWTRTSDTEGLYVAGMYRQTDRQKHTYISLFFADLNLCLTDLHSCAAHQDCIHTGAYRHTDISYIQTYTCLIWCLQVPPVTTAHATKDTPSWEQHVLQSKCLTMEGRRKEMVEGGAVHI